MKYCQKCKVMLKDEVEVCPVCGRAQIPQEEFEAKEQKKKKTRKTVLIAVAAVLAAVLLAYAVVMILGKPASPVIADEVYTEEVSDQDLLTNFADYTATALPGIWACDTAASDSAIEYYQESYPDVAAGFEKMKELQPLIGELQSVTFDGAAMSEDKGYKLSGDLIGTDGKVRYSIMLNSSGYAVGLSFEQKEEPALVRARERLLEILPEDL